VAKAEWKRWDFRCRRNVVRVSQERTLEGRLFQIAGAAERKPRAPNEMLQRVTERRLAEADRRFLDGVPLDQISQIWGVKVCLALWVIVAISNLIRSWIGNQCSWLKVARLEVRLGVRLPPTIRARVFWIRWRREIYFEGMPYNGIRQNLHNPAERWLGQQQ